MRQKLMPKLPCGCIPDASGFGYCRECVRKLRKKIWQEMSPEKRSYDRYFAADQSNDLDDACCSCHMNAPCSFCMEKESSEIVC